MITLWNSFYKRYYVPDCEVETLIEDELDPLPEEELELLLDDEPELLIEDPELFPKDEPKILPKDDPKLLPKGDPELLPIEILELLPDDDDDDEVELPDDKVLPVDELAIAIALRNWNSFVTNKLFFLNPWGWLRQKYLVL